VDFLEVNRNLGCLGIYLEEKKNSTSLRRDRHQKVFAWGSVLGRSRQVEGTTGKSDEEAGHYIQRLQGLPKLA
jgi:hypothetical protein